MKPNWERGTHTKKVLVVYLRERKESCLSLSLFYYFQNASQRFPLSGIKPSGLPWHGSFFFYLFFCNWRDVSWGEKGVCLCAFSFSFRRLLLLLLLSSSERSTEQNVSSRLTMTMETIYDRMLSHIQNIPCKNLVSKLSSRVKLLMCVTVG